MSVDCVCRRVAVTAPVSRTFEAGFDFIFFDWDMYFLSLMAGTSPAAEDAGAWGVAISNLVEVTQTRSVYGHVMNKRAASGSRTSDTNDRTEPLVGSAVVLRIYEDAKTSGSPERLATMEWVIKLLYPTLLGWNQWAWNLRRYNVGKDSPHGGLLVLGADATHLPCEGGTVTSPPTCGGGPGGSSAGGAILESGMDNSPMYYNAFNDTQASWDSAAGRLQLYDVQMSALFVSESIALQQLAVLVAQPAALPMLSTQAKTMAALVNGSLWDETTGIYRQRDASPAKLGFSPVLSPTSFYPMLGGIPSEAQAERMIANHLTNASEFCVDPGAPEFESSAERCPYAIPSISRSDPNFWDNTYWRGRIWGPLNLLVWLSLSHPKYAAMPRVASARKGLCAQAHAALMVEWREKHHVHENLNATNGQGCDVGNSNPFYHWGALSGYISMREAMMVVAASTTTSGGN